MNLADIALGLSALIIYFIVTVTFAYSYIFQRVNIMPMWTALGWAGLVIHTASIAARTLLSRQPPFTNIFEYCLVMAWFLMLFHLSAFKNRIGQAASLVVLIVVVLVLGFAFLQYSDPGSGVPPALRSYWLYIHVSLSALGETFFAIAFATSLIFLVKRNKAEVDYLARLDSLTYRAISAGFPLFTAGALVAGAIWAKRAWGSYWSWDPKEVLSLVVWLVYAIYLHARLVKNLKGTGAAVISIIGFLLTVLTITGTLLLGGLHSYG